MFNPKKYYHMTYGSKGDQQQVPGTLLLNWWYKSTSVKFRIRFNKSMVIVMVIHI